MKKEQFIKIFDLSVSSVLFNFVNKELLPNTGISKNHFLFHTLILVFLRHADIDQKQSLNQYLRIQK